MHPALPTRRPVLRRRPVALALAFVATVALGGCLPLQPPTGRATPVRRVLVLGDSMTFGLYGVTPQLHGPLSRQLMERNISLTIEGFPGESPLDMWPGNTPWSQRLRERIEAEDPDVVVIQSVLLVGADDPARVEAYRTSIVELFDIAQSRGAHVFIVNHHPSLDPRARHEMDVAQQMQADAATGRGIATIPLDWWLARCDRPYILDGWHLTANGQACHATSIVVAIDELRKVVG